MSNQTLVAGSDPARPADFKARPQVTRGTTELGRAYRAGRLVCACVHVTVRLDDRLGLAPREWSIVQVRFHEPLDDSLRTELSQLVCRRGAAACRVAERIDRSNSSSSTIATAITCASSVAWNHRRCATATYVTSSSASAD